MKAIVLSRHGGPEALVLAELPDPVAGPDQVLIRVKAAGVAFGDTLVRQGRYLAGQPLPWIPGIEVAGIVEAVGPGVTHVAPGDRVMAVSLAGGGYAELAVVPARTVWPLPSHAGFSGGACFPIPFLTALVPLRWQARLEQGMTVLVLAAGGGVGSAAVQVARSLGARVIAAAGSEEKLALARQLGAGATLNYSQPGLAVQVRELTGGRGVDAVLDTVGGFLTEECLRCIRPLGTLLSVGYAAGQPSVPDVGWLVGRNVGVQGFYLGRLFTLRPEVVHEALVLLMELWARGEVRPVVGAEYPLEEVALVHELVEERKHLGKVVLKP